MKTVLVTGAGGYISSKLIPKLQKEYKVFALDINSRTELQCGWLMTDINNPDLKDIGEKFDVIIHTVATFTKDPVKAYQVNVDGTRNVLKLAKMQGCKLIFLSTCGTLNSDDHSTYTITKGIAEDSIINDWPEKSTIVRLASVYGTAPVMNYEGIVNNFVRNAFKMRSIEIIGANEYRPIVHIDDAVNSIIQVIDSNRSQLNVVSENVTKQQIADCIVKICNNVTVEAKTSDKQGYKVEPCLQNAVKLEKGIREMIVHELSDKVVNGKRS